MARVSRRNLIKTENVEVINSSRVGGSSLWLGYQEEIL
jgi:hypothetical protein